MTKVCLVNMNIYALFDPQSQALVGGTEVQLFNLSQYFKHYYQVSIITGDWGQSVEQEIGGIKLIKSFDVRRKTIVNYLTTPFILWKKMKQAKADIYIVSAAGMEAGLVALFAQIYGKKFIYRTAHDMDCNGEFIKQHKIVGRLYLYGLKKADKVITQSHYHQVMLKNNYGIKALVLKNAYEVNNFFKNFQKKSYILWVARCSYWKRPELFLKLVAKFPRKKFIMISPPVRGEEKLFKRIKLEAEKYSNLKFIEKVSFFEIQKYFNEAKILVGTSDYEGFPNTYLQACKAATPIVSLKVNPDDFITKNNLGYCAQGNWSDMLKNLKNLLTNDEDYRKKSQNAFRYFRDNHNLEKIGENWRKVIDSIVGGRTNISD